MHAIASKRLTILLEVCTAAALVFVEATRQAVVLTRRAPVTLALNNKNARVGDRREWRVFGGDARARQRSKISSNSVH